MCLSPGQASGPEGRGQQFLSLLVSFWQVCKAPTTRSTAPKRWQQWTSHGWGRGLGKQRWHGQSTRRKRHTDGERGRQDPATYLLLGKEVGAKGDQQTLYINNMDKYVWTKTTNSNVLNGLCYEYAPCPGIGIQANLCRIIYVKWQIVECVGKWDHKTFQA